MSDRRVEFRIPISPTPEFFAQVRFYNFALRRLGGRYRDARLVVVVGDHCDLDAVRAENAWSDGFNVGWERVPDEVFDEFSWWGNSNWRFNVPNADADIVILSDADTVLLQDIEPLIAAFPRGGPAVRGHMAHVPPRHVLASAPDPEGPDFWPWLFGQFELTWPAQTFRYSTDDRTRWPAVPAYFNMGFVALNEPARLIFAAEEAEVMRRVATLTDSRMRCQIATTIVAYRAGMDIGTLPAAYNAANDAEHLGVNRLEARDIRVLHYLRWDEISRWEVQPHLLDALIARPLRNPANVALQDLARAYRAALDSAAA